MDFAHIYFLSISMVFLLCTIYMVVMLIQLIQAMRSTRGWHHAEYSGMRRLIWSSMLQSVCFGIQPFCSFYMFFMPRQFPLPDAVTLPILWIFNFGLTVATIAFLQNSNKAKRYRREITAAV